MKLRILKRWGKNHIDSEWLFLHTHGDYEYRRPDSVYVHRYETFNSREDALDWLDRRIAKGDQPEWKLYRLEAVDATS